MLVRYADTVANYWDEFWKEPDENSPAPEVYEQVRDDLCKSLGEGLLSYLDQQPDGRRLATKTPSVRNLKHFFKIFPGARLILLIRDGRAVVESSVKSFGWSYELATQKWNEAARQIIDFNEIYRGTQAKYITVKYEDILDRPDQELRRVFEFLALDPRVYSFEQALDLPVFGSSQFYDQTKTGNAGWKRMKKTADFDPKSRWQHWSKTQHDRFNWIAGSSMVELGYMEQADLAESAFSQVWHGLLDKRWQFRMGLRSVTYALERKLYAFYLYNRKFQKFPIED